MEIEKIIQDIFLLDSKAMELRIQLNNIDAEIEKKLQLLVATELTQTKHLSADSNMILSTFGYEEQNGEVKRMGENIMADKQNSTNLYQENHYKGFAYIKGQIRASVVHAESEAAILTKLRSWNKARPENLQFITVNIGALDTTDNRYKNYQKYEVITGKNISAIPLIIPPMDKEEFADAIKYFKENGAKYLPSKKQWYITADMDQGLFKSFISENSVSNNVEERQEGTENREYSLSLSRQIEENTCTVYFFDGRDPKILYGDQFGVNFAQMKSAAEAVDIVDGFINRLEKNQEKDFASLLPGEKLECFVPIYDEKGQVIEITPLEAKIEDITETGYKLSNCTISEYSSGVNKEIAFTKTQAAAINRAIKGQISPETLSLLLDSSKSSAVMDIIRASEQDGLTNSQIKSFLDKGYDAAEMDLHRIGLQNGLDADKIHAIATTDNASWADKRNLLAIEIRKKEEQIGYEFKKEGYSINRTTARKINQLNHLTHHINTTDEIAAAFKNKSFSSNEKVQQIVNDVAKEFQMLEVTRLERQV